MKRHLWWNRSVEAPDEEPATTTRLERESVTRLPLALFLCLTLSLLPRAASSTEPPEESKVFVGPVIGGGASQISQPSDPAGSLTFLYGSAFTGGCFRMGGVVTVDMAPFFTLGTDVTYSYTALSGFAGSGGQRMDVTIKAHDIRIALLPALDVELEKVAFELAIGPEVAFGVASSVDEVTLGFAHNETPLATTTGVWFYLVSQASVVVRLQDMEVPFSFRFGWNPAYPDTTAERFDGFNGADEPGELRVGSDWYLAVSAGLRFGI